MTPQNPTLLIAVGRFGRRVATMIAPAEPAQTSDPYGDLLDPEPSNPDQNGASGPSRSPSGVAARALEIIAAGDAVLEREPDEAARAVTEEARQRCKRLLELAYFVATTAPTDARGPRLDIFLIGDLSEARVARLIPLLAQSLARQLRSDFRPIVGAGEGALAVCPLLTAPRRGDPEAIADAVERLAALERNEDRLQRLQARIYIVEDQSGKYLLSDRELERSFAAFLSLLLMSQLRDERGVRDLVEPTGGDRAGPLGTFACATLEIDMAALQELCAIKLARDMLDHFDAGALSLTEIASEAHPLVPDRTNLESQLWQEGSSRSLEDYLEPPDIAVPDISPKDSPERIAGDKFGPIWRLETERAVEQFTGEVERFKMDRLAEQIERNGTELADRLADGLTERVRAEALASPRGPGRALEFARYAATRARGLMDEAKAAIDAPDLRTFPPSPVEPGVAEIERASAAWPRRTPSRIAILGALCAVCVAFVIGGLIHWLLGGLLTLSGSRIPWWLSGLLGAAVASSLVGYTLWRHVKRHYNWLLEARRSLAQALERYLHRDIVDYFRRRLNYTRLLWLYRIYRRITRELDGLVAKLEAARKAVAQARRQLADMEEDLIETRGQNPAHNPVHHPVQADGILYRSVLGRDVVQAFYDHARPPELAGAAGRYHLQVNAQANMQVSAGTCDDDPAAAAEPGADLWAPASVFEAPYADPERALRFARREFSHLGELSPYQQADSPLFRAVESSVTEYLEKLALKLSPPLEVIGAATGNAPTTRHIVIAPPGARSLIERILSEHNLDHSWDIRSVSSDARRIHLLLERGHLPVQAVAIARRSTSASTDTRPTPRDQP